MPGGYGTHADYMKWVQHDAAARHAEVLGALRDAFSSFIELREVEVVSFSTMTVMDLARAIGEYPVILKALLAACNTAARAIERDLDIRNLDTYRPRMDGQRAAAIAGYHATHGIVKHTMPSETWHVVFSLVGAVVVGITAFARLATLAPPGGTGQGVARA